VNSKIKKDLTLKTVQSSVMWWTWRHDWSRRPRISTHGFGSSEAVRRSLDSSKANLEDFGLVPLKGQPPTSAYF